MKSGPVMIQVLEGEDAISVNRRLMGATDPKEAAPGTIRADFAESIDANAVHGSDSPVSAEREIAFFFQDDELLSLLNFFARDSDPYQRLLKNGYLTRGKQFY